MQSLPYELLQLIASNLLPRYQCRLALASSWCYKYLYTDLLKWHCNKQHISVPKYKIVSYDEIDITLSLISIGKNIVSYFNSIALHTLNLSSYIYTFLSHDLDERAWRIEVPNMDTLYYFTRALKKHLIKYNYRKHLHKEVLLALINIHSTSYKVPMNVRTYIANLIPFYDKLKLCRCGHSAQVLCI